MHSSDRMNDTTFAGRFVRLARFATATAMLAVAAVAGHAQVTSVPPVVFSSAAALSASNSQGASNTPNGVGLIGRIASNQRGDSFAIFNDTTSPGYTSLVEIPAGTTQQVLIAKNLSLNVPVVTVDSYGNLWFLTVATNGYDSGIDIIPFVNGTYQTGLDLAATALPACALPANATKVACYYPNLDTSGYLQLSDLAVDAAGNLFVVDWADCLNGCTYDNYINILEYNATTGLATIVVPQIPAFGGGCCNGPDNGRLALDQNDNIFYDDQANLYYSAAGSNAFKTLSGFNTPSGVSSDSSGNIYVTDSGNNRIVVLPNLSGAVTPSSAYTILSGVILGATPYYSVGVDGYGKITYPTGTNGSIIDRAQVGMLNLGSIAVGSTTGASSLTLYFTAAETMGTFTVTGPFAVATNSCPANSSYMIGQNCSITVTYKATAAGPQSGTVAAYSKSGALLGTARLYGSGTASLINVDPGTVSTVGTTWSAPSAISVDATGNTYVADSKTGSIYKNGSTTAIATGFSTPTAVVVDGMGNLYIGDSGNKRVMEVPYSGTAYGTPTAVVTGLSGQSGLAIDDAGNLYIADSGNGRVLLVASGGGLPVGSNIGYVNASVSSTGTLVTNFTSPTAVAADSLGNVYVADGGKIIKVSLKTSTSTTVAQGLSNTVALAVDPGGNVYYADAGTKTITRLPNVGGQVTGSGATVFTPLLVPIPTGIAVDASGSLYAVDTADAIVKKVTRTTGSLSFGNVVQNVASSPLTATLFNAGTASAILANPYEVASGTNGSDFTIQSSSTCASSATLATGTSCNVVEVFKPSTTTAESSTLTFTNTAATLSLSGTGVVLVNATITPASGSIAYGAPVTYSVTVSPNIVPSYPVNFTNAQGVSYSTTVTIGSNGTGTFTSPATLPVGAYTITLVGTVGSATTTVTPAVLTIVVNSPYTRAYGIPNPTFTCKSITGVVNGDTIGCGGTTTATTFSPAGTYTILPAISGAAAGNYTIAPSPTSTNGTLTVTLAIPNVNLKDSPASTASNGTILQNVALAFSATIASLTPGGAVPTGSVTFENATYTNTIVNLVPDSGSSNPAVLNGAGIGTMSTSTLASGTIEVEACYSGDKNYAATCSLPIAITISLPTFTIAVTSPYTQTLVIKQGQYGTLPLTITPIGNYTAPISLACSGLPLEATCTFLPAKVMLSGQAAQFATLQINTTSATSSVRPSVPWGQMGGGVAVAMMFGFFAGWRRKRIRKGLCAFLMVAMLGLLMPITGCGNGLNEPNFVTPYGTYTSVVVTGSSASTGVLVNLSLRLSVTQ